MPSLIYSPGVRVFIATMREGVIDISDDIVSGTVRLTENQSSYVSLAVANHGRKYDGVFSPNDRISIQLKRFNWMQSFAGYLNEVPYFSVYPRTIPLSAECTLKRLRYFLWDPSAPESTRILQPGQGIPLAPEMQNDMDGGLATRVTTLLTKVGQWPEQNVHIGLIPEPWTAQIKMLYSQVKGRLTTENPALSAATTGLGSAPSVNGTNPISSGSIVIDPDPTLPQATGTIPNNGFGKASYFAGVGNTDATGSMALTGEPGTAPVDEWYCAMRWPYVTVDADGAPATYLAADKQLRAKNWWRDKKILVVNPLNMKAVVLRAADWGPHGKTDRVIDMSRHALEVVLGARTDTGVHIRFAPKDAALGPYVLPPSAATASAPMVLAPGVTQAAADFAAVAAAQIGDTYKMGAETNPADLNPGTFDCSELVQWAAAQVGISFADGTTAQWAAIQAAKTEITVAQAALTRGALLFHPGHVAISVGDGVNTIEAMGEKYGVVQGNISQRFSSAGLIPGMRYDAAAAGLPAGSDPTYTSGSGPQTLINPYNWTPSFGDDAEDASHELRGLRALLNDVPLFETIQQFCKVSMRSFMAAPNGDFIAWFPDYFGNYGTAGRMVVEPIELEGDGFTMQWADAHLITHQFVAGADIAPAAGDPLEGGVDQDRIFQTHGIASVEFPEILSALFNIKSNDDPRASLYIETEKLLNRYGARTDYQPIGYINDGLAEFWYAVYLFQRSWANQFSSQVNLTFMPELFPGMLLQIPDFKIQFYVEAVTHTFDFHGGGFSTTCVVAAPSATDAGGLYALPRAGGS